MNVIMWKCGVKFHSQTRREVDRKVGEVRKGDKLRKIFSFVRNNRKIAPL